MTSGLISTFSTTYGVSADNYVDAEFIAADGSFFALNDVGSPNLYAFHESMVERGENGAICVSVSMKLHPVTDDEEGILIPFESLEASLVFSRNCATRHIGLAIGILGSEFVSSFMAPQKSLPLLQKMSLPGNWGCPTWCFSSEMDTRYVPSAIWDIPSLTRDSSESFSRDCPH